MFINLQICVKFSMMAGIKKKPQNMFDTRNTLYCIVESELWVVYCYPKRCLIEMYEYNIGNCFFGEKECPLVNIYIYILCFKVFK